jgi:hypothetical protein
MKTPKINIISNMIWSFLIGIIAGISPFLFMQLLPRMSSPSLYADLPYNFAPVVITGILVGAITSIIFSKSFSEKEPHEVFFYALGIPAILVATVSNITTDFKAGTKIKDATQIVSQPPPQLINIKEQMGGTSEPEVLTPPPNIRGQSFLSVQTAWASGSESKLVAQGKYLVVIGTYNTENEAWKTYRRYQKIKFQSENYATKDLQVLKINAGYYVLVYSRHYSREEAISVYKILKLNNPELNPKIITY